MKNVLAPVTKNQIVSEVFSEVKKFYLAHESTILMGGTIGFSVATTAVAMHNAAEINYILTDAKGALACCNTDEEKKHVYTMTLKRLVPLVAPIIIFQGATIALVIKSKKKADEQKKKIAEITSALAVANSAITQYQTWQKQTEEALGEKKYEKLQNDIYKNQEFDGRRFPALASEGAPGEVLIIDKYSGKPFWGYTTTIENAAKGITVKLESGGYDFVSLEDYYELIGNPDLIDNPGALACKFGYVPGGYGVNDICARFADTHYVFPNGTKIPAFEAYLYPEPACVDWEI